ncbi:DUF3221 domain-containing protein [Bacillus thermotolerans]|uniref:DUF3221 domain-containing protein n=1 Tax=Bacillus thermotolerans TaxID=1221996 RepID=UPI00057ED9E8|nr:DUF3221 domain-containing protein [Bacillus thermotolerans]
MYKKILTITSCILLFVLSACSSEDSTPKESTPIHKNGTEIKENKDSSKYYVTTGYIVRKDEIHIRVMPEITKEELKGKNEKELESLLRKKYEGKGVNFDIDKIDQQTMSSLHVGQRVVIKHDMFGLSAPANGGNALKIKVIEE